MLLAGIVSRQRKQLIKRPRAMKPPIVSMVCCAVRDEEDWSGRKGQSQPGKGLPYPKAGLRLMLAVAETLNAGW